MTKPVKPSVKPAAEPPTSPPAKPGRPSDYNPIIAAAICEAVSEGQTLRTICALPGMPDKATVCRWLAALTESEGKMVPAHPEFRDQYARAREAQADTYAEEIIEIADEVSGDYKIVEGEDGVLIKAFDAENVQRSKLRVDARKWLASKRAPKVYGDEKTAPTVAVTVNAGTTDDMAIAQRIAFLLMGHRPKKIEGKK